MLEEQAALAAEQVRGEGPRPRGEGGLLPEPVQHLMRAALEAETDEQLAAWAGHTNAAFAKRGYVRIGAEGMRDAAAAPDVFHGVDRKAPT
ncbi:hypothetical protein JL475_01020 [Streptomyces sp. M2CJ-2]|uniref:hypothetical protein n=1 Tax=Streptomyces sp. M2CJ-2 TaxID=2803948 RepID=UPI001924127F|nr:hypothetical protein [Streptomyces sp. M2CJ-2]MBL3664626.1 hypothetical protein [Streptomyces sp. M2CJ-2]